MDFRTQIELPVGLPPITHAGQILMMGSCFVQNVGNFLKDAKFQLDLNPFGILYNPSSLSAVLIEILKRKVYKKGDLFFHNDLWHSPMHHGLFSGPTLESTLQNINIRLLQVHQAMQKLDWLMLTFGTAYVYEQKETGKVVSNCHKLPENKFNRRLLSVEEIVEDYTALITEMAARNPELKDRKSVV